MIVNTGGIPTREQLIKQRQKESPYWWLVHQLGSLKLAMFLIFTIALAIAIATFAESSFSTKVAQEYIYKAPWFNLWLIVLCVNLFSVTLTRWPWQNKHLGFIVTHYGIITLLVGAMIGRIWGFEGNVTLDKDKPLGRIITNRTILQVDSPRDHATYITDVDVSMHPPRLGKTVVMPIPDSDRKIILSDYTESIQAQPYLEAAIDNPESVPGVNLRLQSAMMSQTFEVPLWLKKGSGLESYDLFGLATLKIVKELPTFDPAKMIKPGEGIPFSENQIVFAKSPESTVIDNSWGKPSGYIVTFLVAEEGTQDRVKIISPEGLEKTFDLTAKLPAKFILEDGVNVSVSERWTDFAIVKGRPGNASKEKNNPALFINLSGRIQPGPRASKSLPHPELIMAIQPDGRIMYMVMRGEYVTMAGKSTEGEPIIPGWADWSVTPLSVFQKAIPLTKNVVLTDTQVQTLDPKTLTPALKASIRTSEGQEGPVQWIPSGEVVTLEGPDGSPQRVGFGLQAHQIPFLITLQEFQVPRRQGTDDPADYISTIQFNHLKTGDTSIQTSKMNHPATYPNEWWRPLTGLTYKFSQAQWDPNNLNQTTLQVLYDPGWFFKWIGSLGICAGIFIMFYCKPYAKPATSKNKEINPTTDTATIL